MAAWSVVWGLLLVLKKCPRNRGNFSLSITILVEHLFYKIERLPQGPSCQF